MLEDIFGLEKIKEAIWMSDTDKIMGPDSYNMGFFFKNCWNSIKDDVVAFVNEFHFKDKLLKAITTSFLALIPKKDNSQ